MRNPVALVQEWLTAAGIGVAKHPEPEIMGHRMQPKDDSCPTRSSLLERLKDTSDERSWQEFSDLYSGIIRRFAVKAGLNDVEAEEVVQDTLVSLAKNLPEFRYDPQQCSFKAWMLNLVRWRINSLLRQRAIDASRRFVSNRNQNDDSRTATVERVPDPAGVELEAIWDREWKEALLQKALERVKAQVDSRQWQIFDLYSLKDWSPAQVAKTLGVTVGRVYLTRHRVAKLVKRELERV